MNSTAEVRYNGVVIHPLNFSCPEEGELAFARADLVFEGVPHDLMSYEVRIFLDNPEADADTPRDFERGYAVYGAG